MVDWTMFDPDAAGQGNAFVSKNQGPIIPGFAHPGLNLPTSNLPGRPPAGVPVQLAGAAGIPTPNNGLIPYPSLLEQIIFKPTTLANRYGVGPWQKNQLALADARQKLVSAARTQQRLEAVTEMDPGEERKAE